MWKRAVTKFDWINEVLRPMLEQWIIETRAGYQKMRLKHGIEQW
jgi:hypothetical protein